MSTGKLIETVETLRAEVASLKASQCTSPWEDSPPCRGIQRQLDIVADLTQQLAAAKDDAKTAMVEAECLAASCKSVTEQLAAANGRLERMRMNLHISNEMLRGEGIYSNQVRINDTALSDLPEADKEKS